MPKIFSILVSLLLAAGLNAQDNNWSLQRAVDYAVENNLTVGQLRAQKQLTDIQLQQNRLARMPNISASGNVGFQLGRTIDPTSNEFIQQNILFNGLQAQASITLYNGGSIRNGIRQAELDAQAAQLQVSATSNDIGLQVATSYLNVLLVREQLNNARAQLSLVDGQIEQTDLLIEGGAIAPAQRLDLVAQQASAQRSVVELENQLEISLLSLQQILQLDYSPDFNIIVPDLQINQVDLSRNYSFEEVYTAAQQTQPDLRIAEINQQSAAVGIKVARAGFAPNISLFGSLSTNYSDVAKDFSNPDLTNAVLVPEQAVPVQIDGSDAMLTTFDIAGVTFPDKSYVDQLNENFGQSIGISFNVPIYSQGRNRLNVQRAEVTQLQSDIQLEQTRVDLQNEVQSAIANLRSSQAVYQAAQISLEAAEAAYAQGQRRYDLGAATTLDLLTATNRLEQARIESTRSKYQLIFNQQVIRFYLGDRLSLN